MGRLVLCVVALFLLLAAGPVHVAEKLKGDDAKPAKERVKDAKRDWKKASKAQKFEILLGLQRYPEAGVTSFLEDAIKDEADDEVALVAAWVMVKHAEPDDIKLLLRLYGRAKTPERRAATLRWLGRYGADAPLKELKRAAEDKDGCASAATEAIAEIATPEAMTALEAVATGGTNADARRVALSRLLAKGDSRGVDALGNAGNLEDAAQAAHFAIGTELETTALKKVLEFARKGMKLAPGVRPQFFGSLLVRLTRRESHQAVLDEYNALVRQYEPELAWWLVSCNRGPVKVDTATRFMGAGTEDADARERLLSGLRLLQRMPARLEGADLAAVEAALAPLLEHADDEVVSHAMLTACATGAAASKLEARVAAWLKDEKPLRVAAALLASGRANMSARAAEAVQSLKHATWYVQSAALDALLHLRAPECAPAVLELARTEGEGRLFGECIALLCDLTGQDHGDDLAKWDEWLKANADFKAAPRKLEGLRGVDYTRTKQKTGATFYGLEINSLRVQFAIDRSVSMVNPVAREPDRADFADRKADILKRRPEVGRMMRDGFLPRFHVTASETAAALDGLSQKAKFGLTLFNHEFIEYKRVNNDIASRRDAVNWMLSTDIQGGTDIKNALLAIIEKAEADTIVLLSDGDPLSAGILEQIHRANAIKRLNVLVVSVHKLEQHRHYMNALASREGGRIVDAEPKDP